MCLINSLGRQIKLISKKNFYIFDFVVNPYSEYRRQDNYQLKHE